MEYDFGIRKFSDQPHHTQNAHRGQKISASDMVSFKNYVKSFTDFDDTEDNDKTVKLVQTALDIASRS